MKLLHLLLVLGLSASINGFHGHKKIIVTFDISATKLTGNARCVPEDLNPKLFTHLILNHGDISADYMLIPADPDDTEVYDKINDLKKNHPKLQTFLTVNVMKEFIKMLATNETRHTFINSTIELLQKQNFTGLNIFLYSLNQTNMELLIDLIKELSEAFKNLPTGETELFLSLMVTARTIYRNTLNLTAVHKYLEFIIVRTDLLNNKWNNMTVHQSPLYSNPPYSEYSLASLMKMAARNAPKKKLIPTIPAFGRGYTLADPNNHEVGAPIVGQSPPGPYTRKEGFLAYDEICDLLNMTANTTWLPVEHVPVMVNGSSWVGYDDERSVEEKAAWVITHGFGGLVLHKLSYDDCKGVFCGKGPFPLLNTIHRTLV